MICIYIYIYIQREEAEMVTSDWLVKCCLQAIRYVASSWNDQRKLQILSHRKSG